MTERSYEQAVEQYRDTLHTLKHLGEVIKLHQEELATRITDDSKLPQNFTRFDVGSLVDILLNYEDVLRQMHEGTIPHPVWQKRGPVDISEREGIGQIAAVLPYNGPAMTFGLAFAPAKLLRKKILIKPASESGSFFQSLEQIVKENGLGPLLRNDDGSPVITRTSGRKFFAEHLSTSSPTKVFQYYGTDAVVDGRVREMVKRKPDEFYFILEGPGKNRFIVTGDLPEDRYEETAAIIAQLGTINGGQTCMGAEIFDIHADVAPKLIPLIREKMRGIVVGDPYDERTMVPPLRKAFAERMYEQIADALSKGARLEYVTPLADGKIPLMTDPAEAYGHEAFTMPAYDEKHLWVPAVVLSNTNENMRVRHDETFGPLIAIGTFKNDSDLIPRIMYSHYGLGASVFGDKLDENHPDLMQALRENVGNVFENKYMFDPDGGFDPL
ncbi:aldehyde dehydrogenase family protein, partial [Candidatus Woesearchaeota archaeon]